MRDLVWAYIHGNPFDDQVRNELSQIGAAEITASSNLPIAEIGPGFDMWCKIIQKEIAPPSFMDRLTRRKPCDLNLENGVGVLQSSIRKLEAQRKEIYKHRERITLMAQLAQEFDLAIQEIYYNASCHHEWLYIVRERHTALTTHLAVLTQGILATNILIENARTLISSANHVLSTYKLAKRVNNRVREISENNALALESGATERRPSNCGLEFFDEQGNRYNRENGWREYNDVQRSAARALFGLPPSSES